jgi:hypothetical protein
MFYLIATIIFLILAYLTARSGYFSIKQLFVYYLLVILLIFACKNLYILLFQEGFDSGNDILNTVGQYPSSLDGGYLDSYPLVQNPGVSTNSASTIWQEYPIFQVGSYDQITNNLRYPKTPDDGTCTPAEFCGSIYKGAGSGASQASVITPLPPVCDGTGIRVNYYRS